MDSDDRDLFFELVGYVSADPCMGEKTGTERCLCLPCRARENYEAHKKHLREVEAAPKKRLVFAGVDMGTGPDQTWVDFCQGVIGNVSKQFDAATEHVLKEIGPEHVSHIEYRVPQESSLRRTIVGHDREFLGEVWIEWPDPLADRYEVTFKGRYRVHATCLP